MEIFTKDKKKDNILVIDDEQSIRNLLVRTLTSSEYNVESTGNSEEALTKLKAGSFSLVITDIKLPGMSGIEILKKVKEIDKNIEVIMITGYATVETASESLRDGAFDFINKPFDIHQLELTVKKAISSYHTKKTIVLLNEGLTETYIELEKLKDSLEEKVMERTEKLAMSEKKYRSIIDNSFDPIITINDKLEVSSWNKGAELILGYKEADVLGKEMESITVKNKNEDFTSLIAKIKTEGFIRNHILIFASKNAGNIIVNLTANKIDGEGISFILRDITREKRIDQMKSDFVSNVSHELRTPLTSIKGAIDLLLSGAEGSVTPSQKEFLNISKNNSMRLIRLITDLLDLSKIESGKIKMEIKPGNIVIALKDTITEFKSIVEKNKIKLVYSGPESVQVYFDEDRIRQVITNLIGNAIKFTPENGTITVKLSELDETVQIGVSDTGIGIAKENFEMVFEKFQQVDSSSTRAKGGTGLGLAITKSIVEAHKGRIWIESELGLGSTFIFEIPKVSRESIEKTAEFDKRLDMAAFMNKLEASQQSFKVTKVLVIDDDDDMVQVIKAHLEKDNYEVMSIRSSKDALKTALEFKPDLITLDLLMPQVDGFAVAELLKQNPTTKDIPIVIISAIFEKTKAYKLGISDYITKPFDHKDLIESIKNVEIQMTGEMHKKTILVVDDDPDISSVLSLSLSENNYSVLNCYDGLQAIATAKKEKPNIIILDIMLPEVDGFQVLTKLKEDPETASIPIIIITGKGDQDRDKAFKLGAKDFLLKPFSIKLLLDQLDGIIKNK